MSGAISLLKYLSAALLMPGAPRLPIEVGFDGLMGDCVRADMLGGCEKASPRFRPSLRSWTRSRMRSLVRLRR